jgi:hypothetical protein
VQQTNLDILWREGANSPAILSYLKENFTGADVHLADLLLSEAEDSPFPIYQWLESLLLFEEWLNSHGLVLPIENQIGYVACSASAGSAYATLTQLPMQVEEMLNNYGCDDAVPK